MQTKRLFPFLCLLLILTACAQAPTEAVHTLYPLPLTSTPSVTSIPQPVPDNEAPIYPPPNPDPFAILTPDSQYLTAYPMMKQTETALLLTLTALPTRTPLPTNTATPTITPTFTRAPASIPLPAPLYFVQPLFWTNTPPQQIWRMERDGITLTQVTDLKEGVTRFDISPRGEILYLYQNALIVTDAWGKNPRMLLQGKVPPTKNTWDEWFNDKEQIHSPVWSPDGGKIAYYRDGINILDLNSGKSIHVVDGRKWVLNSQNIYELEQPRSQFYFPFAWTPDGTRIIVNMMGYETASTGIVPAVANGTLTKVDVLQSGCCDFSFTHDSKMLFSSGDHSLIGLWLVDPLTGKGQELTKRYSDNPFDAPNVSLPKQSPDGQRIYFFNFYGMGPDSFISRLAYVDKGNFPFRIPEDVHFVDLSQSFNGVLWAEDASQVIVEDNRQDLWQIDIATGAAHPFWIQAFNLHWGPSD
jgi:hypothetical protein